MIRSTSRLCCRRPSGLLQACHQATWNEVSTFIERERLCGLGCGLVDLCLLTSTLITPGAHLWTLDKRLVARAERFGIAWRPIERH